MAIGSASLPMHISAKTKQPDLAAAYLDSHHRPRRRAGARRHAAGAGGDRRDGRAGATTLGQEVKAGWDQLVEDGGLTLFPDWSSPTMLQTMGQTFQEMLAGRIPPEEVVEKTQADWEEYHAELAEG